MTVPSSVAKSGPYNCNGVTDVFNYDFRIVDKSHLNVILADADGAETSLTLTTHYTVSDVGDDTGSINLTSAGVALAITGTTLTILRNPPFTQETDLENQGAYLAQTVEDRFDLLTMQIQTVKERSDRSIAIAASDEDTTLDDLTADLVKVAGIADDVSTVAARDTDIGTVAARDTAIATVAARDADIGTVAARDTDIGTVADRDADIGTVAGISDDVAIVAGMAGQIPDLADAVMKADTDASSFGFVIDEDDMASDSDEKLPTQQSVNVAKLQKVATRTAMKALSGTAHPAVYLYEAGREGNFKWDSSDLSAKITADTEENTYVAPSSDPTGASGAWVRQLGQYVPLFNPARIRSLQERLSEGVFLDDFLGTTDTDKALDFAENSDEKHLALPGRTINIESTIAGTNKYWTIKGRGTAATRIEWQGTSGPTPVFKFIRDEGEIHALYQVSDVYFNTSVADSGIPIWVEEQRPDDANTYVLGGIDLLHIDRVIMEASGDGYWRRYLNSVNAGGILINRFQGRNNGSSVAQTDTDTNGLLFTNSQSNLFIIRTLFMSQFNIGRVYSAISFNIANSFESCYLSDGEIVGVRDGLLSTGAGKMGATGIGHVHMDVTHSGVFSNLSGGMNYIRLNGTDIRRGNNGANYEAGNCVHLAGASRYFTANGCTFSGNRTANPTMAQSGILFSGQEAGAIDGNFYLDLQYGNQFGNAVANVAVGDANVYDTVEQNNIVTSTNASTISIGSPKGSWSTSVVKTLTGGAATEVVDIAIPAGVLTGDPASATLIAESGTTFFNAIFQQTDAATTPINARFLIARTDGTNITAGAVRFGVTVHA